MTSEPELSPGFEDPSHGMPYRLRLARASGLQGLHAVLVDPENGKVHLQFHSIREAEMFIEGMRYLRDHR